MERKQKSAGTGEPAQELSFGANDDEKVSRSKGERKDPLSSPGYPDRKPYPLATGASGTVPRRDPTNGSNDAHISIIKRKRPKAYAINLLLYKLYASNILSGRRCDT